MVIVPDPNNHIFFSPFKWRKLSGSEAAESLRRERDLLELNGLQHCPIKWRPCMVKEREKRREWKGGKSRV